MTELFLVLDVSLAFFHPEITRTVCCELPDEDKTEGEDQVGELLKTMYGTRDATAECEGHNSEVCLRALARKPDCSVLVYSLRNRRS